MSVWKRLTNVAKGTVKTWTKGDGDRDLAALEAELDAMDARTPRQDRAEPPPLDGGRPAARDARVDPAREPVPRTDLLPSAGPEAGAGKRDLLGGASVAQDGAKIPVDGPAPVEATADDDATPAGPATADPDGPLGAAAGRVLDAVDDVIGSTPDPFAGFQEPPTWELLPSDEDGGRNEGGDPAGEVEDVEEVKRRL